MTFDIYAISAELKTLMSEEHPTGENIKDFIRTEEIKISGKSAAMCYLKDDFGKILANNEGAALRFSKVVATHHHSIAEHAHVEVIITGISKVLAMILNNQRIYCTSEKSGRYTDMSTSVYQDEKRRYDTWYRRLYDVLMSRADSMTFSKNENPEQVIDKLAKENARYVLDIFSPIVSMCYTCSLSQWNYLAQWMREAIPRLDYQLKHSHDDIGMVSYCSNLKDEFEKFSQCIEDAGLIIPGLINRKGRKIDTMIDNYSSIYGRLKSTADMLLEYPTVDVLDDNIVVRYKASFAAMAQLQRHRTSRFTMSVVHEGGAIFRTADCYDYDRRMTYFCPTVLCGMEYVYKEWNSDMNLVARHQTLPIATKIAFKMTTTFEDFRQIMMERCCGRAQFETYKTVAEIHQALFRQSSEYREFCADYNLPQRGVTKCMMQKCAEPCRFIAKGLEHREF